MFKNMNPQDTRLAEYISAWGMFFSGVIYGLGTVLPLPMAALAPVEFWTLNLSILGMLQLIGLLLHPRVEVLRIASSLTNGAMWVWMTLSFLLVELDPLHISTAFLGLSNLYAFIINTNLMRIKWET